jgi:glyceraldehyde 3-phosphate dehydrogenase
MAKVAINGMGRIGRAVFKQVLDNPDLTLAAMNDLLATDNLAYLLKFDSVYGRYEKDISSTENSLVVDGTEYPVWHEKDPESLPWKKFNVDIVFECTGIFLEKQHLEKHLKAGAKRVILSAPPKQADIDMVVPGVNQSEDTPDVISCASCTTNCIAPVVEIVGRTIGMKKAVMTTVHAYTSSQSIVDGPHKKWRRGRAGAINFVPTSTGAAKAATKVLPQYKDLFDGVAIRGPVPVGSIADLVFVLERDVTLEEVSEIFKKEAESSRYQGILGVADAPIVSTDIIKDDRASIVDLSMTQVVGGDLLKIMSWYDNEWGYSAQMVRQAVRMAKGLSR